MKLIKIKLYIYQLIYSQIKHTKLMTQNMRSPGNGFLGNIAKELMIVFNEFVYNDSIKKLNVKKNDNVIEIGSGNGQGIKKLLNLTSKNIISIEVSDTFRNKLIQKFKNQNVTILSNDAKNLSNIVEDTSPQLGGDLDTNSHNILVDDAHAVKFGDSTDLQIYHNGNSIIENTNNSCDFRIISEELTFLVRFVSN